MPYMNLFMPDGRSMHFYQRQRMLDEPSRSKADVLLAFKGDTASTYIVIPGKPLTLGRRVTDLSAPVPDMPEELYYVQVRRPRWLPDDLIERIQRFEQQRSNHAVAHPHSNTDLHDHGVQGRIVSLADRFGQ